LSSHSLRPPQVAFGAQAPGAGSGGGSLDPVSAGGGGGAGGGGLVDAAVGVAGVCSAPVVRVSSLPPHAERRHIDIAQAAMPPTLDPFIIDLRRKKAARRWSAIAAPDARARFDLRT
jgi:hypothetical protein